MEQVSYTLRLDLKDTGIVNTGFRLKQGDSGMKISVSIFNRGVNVFDSTTVPKIVFKRPDGASVMANMTVGSSVYEYVFVGNELQQPGVEIMDVKFTLPNDRRESSVSCSFVVVPDTITPNTHGQDIYDNDLAELVAEATAAAETVEEVVGDSEAWAVGERNGVPVGPEDPAYHNNSKWWSEQANVTSLAALTDVDLNTPSNGDLLQFDSTSGKWKNSADVWDTMAQNGAHNLAVCKIDSGVENGLTWIEQDDGSAIATASSMSGNANITTTEFSLKKGRYILSKNPHIGNSRIALLVNGSVYDNVITYDDEIEFTLANDSSACKIRFYCTAPTGGVVESTKIQPMIRLAIDKDTTYQQGAKTNRQLTDDVNIEEITITPASGVTIDYKSCMKQGKMVTLNCRFVISSTYSFSNNGLIASINCHPKTNGFLVPTFKTWAGTTGGVLQINPNGSIVTPDAGIFTAGSYVISVCFIVD